MAIYTVRQNLSLSLNRVIYPGGSQVELNDAQAKFYGHLLEDTDADPIALVFSGNLLSQIQDLSQAISLVQAQINNLNPDTAQQGTINLNVLPETWTSFADANIFRRFRVLTSAGLEITDAFEYRQFSGQWQIYSLLAQNNLQIILSN